MKSQSRAESILSSLRLPPHWILLVCLASDAATAGWRAVSTVGAREPGFFLLSLVWPGLTIFAAVYLFAWLGWALDID